MIFNANSFGQSCPLPDPLDIVNPITHDPTCFINSGDCTSKDLELVGAFLDVGDTCNSCDEGEQITAELFLSINNTTGSTRTSFAIFGNLEVAAPDGTTILCPISRCNGDIPPNQITTLSYGSITFTCGEELTLKDMVLSWTDASPNSTCDQHDCKEISPKCGTAEDIVITPPLNAVASSECNDQNTVDVNLSVLGGKAPFTYDWSFDESGDFDDVKNPLGLAPETTYTVVVKDSEGCTTTTTILTPKCFVCPTLDNESPDITTCEDDQGQLLSVDTDISNIDIKFVYFSSSQGYPYSGGTQLGTAVTPSGGTATSSEGILGFAPGTYYAYAILDTIDSDLSDSNCRPFAETIITVNPLPIAEISGELEICEGTTTTLTASGGTVYLWSSSAHGGFSSDQASIEVSEAGDYTVTVTDANGCADEATVTVVVNDNPTVTAEDASVCLGESIQLEATPAGGTWSGTGVSATGLFDSSALSAGDYEVTYSVTDTNTCDGSDSATVMVNVLPEPVAEAASVCLGESVQLEATPVGGTWSGTGVSATGLFDSTGLTADDYEVTYTVTDSNTCVGETTATVTVNERKNPIFDAVDAICEGDVLEPLPTVSLHGIPGTWAPALDNTTTTEYAFTPDDGECANTATLTITVNPAPMVEITGDDSYCYNGNGVVLDAGAGYSSYLWSPGGETTQTITAPEGSYIVAVTNEFGCTTTSEAFTVTNNQQMGCTIVQDVLSTDHLTADGVATVNPSGGNGVYTYLWDNGETTQKATTLTYGMHSVTVTDSNGCETSCQIDIAKELYCWINLVQNVSVRGGSDGAARVNGNGGFRPFTYQWEDGSTQQLNSKLDAGTHYVVITDAIGATSRCSVTITEPTDGNCDSFMATVAQDKLTTDHLTQDGVATVYPKGGTAPFTYLWDNGETRQTATRLTYGLRSVTITDASGCKTSSQIDIAKELYCWVNLNGNVSVYGNNDGSATVFGNGGYRPYTFKWEDGTTAQLNPNLSAGTHYVTIMDSTGATSECSITISQPNQEICDGMDNDGNGQVDEGFDQDEDGIPDCKDDCDNRIDTDGDGIPDCDDICDGGDDNVDTDGDGTPDSCDECDDDGDDDGDGVKNCNDICEGGDDNVDTDGDGTPDFCDTCNDDGDDDGDGVKNCDDICEGGDDNVDTDGDGTPDSCDECDDEGDDDGDGVKNCDDICEGGDDNVDSDGDGLPDFCDSCNDDADDDDDGVKNCNDICEGGDDNVDSDGDGTPDSCDECDDDGDDDGDGVKNCDDICSLGDDNVDTDGDGTPDSCDECDDDGDDDGDGVKNCDDICEGSDDNVDSDGDGLPDFCDSCNDDADDDDDGVKNCNDICEGGDDNVDSDGDGTPDSCDECDEDGDDDGDRVKNCDDICSLGDDNVDTDGDGTPDSCDECDDDGDDDGDGVKNCDDICSLGDDNVDTDGDGTPDSCEEEVCDGVDNNGDGQIDEGLDCNTDPDEGCETAFAYYAQDNTCFLDDDTIKGNRWGWTNFLSQEGEYTMDLYSGAGQCDLSKGDKSGNVIVNYVNDKVSIKIDLLEGFVMNEVQIYVGDEKYPLKNGKPTVAPGQYPFVDEDLNTTTTYDFGPIDINSNGGLYVIVHAVTCANTNDSAKSNESTKVTTFPTIFNKELNVQVESAYASPVAIEIFDLNGRLVVHNKNDKLKVGTNKIKLEVGNLAPDMYIVILKTNREKFIRKVISKK